MIRIRCLCLLAVAFSTSAANAADLLEAIEHYQEGLAALHEQDLDLAILEFTESIRLAPSERAAYLSRAWTHHEKKEYGKAIDDCSCVLKKNPRDTEAVYTRGVAYTEKGDFAKALLDLNRAIRLDNKDARYYRALGICYAKKGELDKAFDYFTRAVELDPKDAETYLYRGYIYFREDDFDRALANYNRAIELKPKNPIFYSYRGMAYMEKGKRDALSEYDRWSQLDLGWIGLDPDGGRGKPTITKSGCNKALADFDRAIQLGLTVPRSRSVNPYRGRAIAYMLKGERAKALADFERVIQLGSENPLDYCHRGFLLVTSPRKKLRDGEQALKDARRACELTKWSEHRALDLLALAYAETGDFKSAIKWVKKALSLEKPLALETADMFQRHLSLFKQRKRPYPPEEE